jgi:hypothetical protein
MRKLIAAVCAAIAVLVVLPPDAQASPELAYLNRLTDRGMIVYDAVDAATYGWVICSALNYNTGDVVTRNVFATTTWADVPNLGTAWILVESAVETLCPWHDHRGFVA